MDYKERALQMHRQWKGKIRVEAACSLTDRDDLSTAYTPGVAAPCLEISRDPDLSYTYTRRGRSDRRNRGTGAGRYRPRGGHAGYGG